MNEFIPLMVIIPIACALLMNLFSKQNKFIKTLSIIVAIALPVIPLIASYGTYYFGGHAPITNNLTNFEYHLAITYSFDFIQQIFLVLLGIITFLVVLIYVSNYKKASGPNLFLIFMGTASASAILLSDDIFHIFIFFEIIAVVQVGLIAASTIKNRYETALKYMILGSIGGPMFLLGIGFLLAITGSVNISDIAQYVHSGLLEPTSSLFLLSCGLIFFGWLYSSGIPPFHTIKSEVYSKSEPHTAALIQVFTVFCLIAIAIVMFSLFYMLPIFNTLLIIFAVISMLLGVTMALTQTDFRRMIGFLAVGELGYIILGMGLGNQLGITAGIFQGFNEIITTALLFIGFGAISYTTKIQDTKELGGLIAKYPTFAIMLLIGGFAMAGVPPLNGFQSKLMIIQASLQSGYPELAVIAIIISIITFMVFVKTFYAIFLKPQPRKLDLTESEIPSAMIFAVFVLLVLSIVIGLFPEIVVNPISQFVGGLL